MEERVTLAARTAVARLHWAGFEAWIVGGCVRDLLLGRAPKDFDLSTNALPGEIKEVFDGERVIETGIVHGTVTVVLEGEPLEITTYRVDGVYSDARHPDRVRFTPSLREDAARRDFTVNAMAWNKRDGLRDFFGGQEDLERRLIRCVGDPALRFREDALRILRALRFSSVLDFSIEADTLSAARERSRLLEYISVERIYAELSKLLCGPGAGRIVALCPDILGVVLPEWRSDPVETGARLDAVPAVPYLRWAALLWEEEDPEGILRRLKSDRKTRERVGILTRNRRRPLPERDGELLCLLGEMGETMFFDWLSLCMGDALQNASSYCTKKEMLIALELRAKRLLSQSRCLHVRDLKVRGEDLLALGLRGPAVGDTQKWLLRRVMEGEIPNEREKLLQGLEEYDSQSVKYNANDR